MATAGSVTGGVGFVPSEARGGVAGKSAAGGARVPWYIWVGAVAVTSSSIGGAWDVSWHRTIGRDAFLTPAHMAIYMCGVLAGVIGLWLVAQCTFVKDGAMRASSVEVLGLRAPLGVFVAGWGGLAMLTSAPFDNWWHNAYGLDVKIVSPPHALLILGLKTVGIGVLFLILAAMNRAAAAGTTDYKGLQRLFLYIAGLSVGGQMFFVQEYTWDVGLHRVMAYVALAIAVPVLLAAFSEASGYRWTATVTSLVYMAFVMGEILILPLFPAQPKLGPVYFPVTHMVPASFPVLLVVPALALDLLWQRAKGWTMWQVAVVSGVVFVALAAAVEWEFAKFLMSKASQNRVFGTMYFGYNARPASLARLRQFVQPDSGAVLWLGLARASVYAAISTWIGLLFGRWMRGVQR